MHLLSRILGLFGLVLASVYPMVHAQNTYPARPITMIVPFPAGGPTDIVARLVARELSDQMGQTVVVENKGGANATIGMQAAVNANADGYTLLYNTSSLVLAPNLYRNLKYDPLKDLAPVTSTAVVPMVLLVHPSVPANDIHGFIEYARQNPGKLSYASAGAGNATHLAAFLFVQTTGLDVTHIPYRGSAPGLIDLVGGQVQFMTNTINDSLPFIRDGRLKALAITTAKRSDLLPDVPTFAETVMPGFDSGAWQGVVVPAGTPEPIIDKLNADIRQVLQRPAVLEHLARQGTQALGASRQDYATYIASEHKRWGEVIRAAGVVLD